MLGTVLVPLDGSGFAEAALPIAKQLVTRSGGRLSLITAELSTVIGDATGELANALASLSNECRRDDEMYLVRTAAMLGNVGDGPVRHGLVDGPAGEAICREAERIHAGMIVMATHGRSALERVWLGSVADYVIRHAARPVLLVRPRLLGAVFPPAPIRNILVPLDPSTFSEAILESALRVAQLMGATITLLTVVTPRFGLAEPELPPPVPQHPAIVARRSDEAHYRLERLARLYRAMGLLVRTRVATAATPAAGILAVLEESRFDMVALATHGAEGLRRLVTGSVADRVLRGSEKPMLVYHPLAA